MPEIGKDALFVMLGETQRQLNKVLRRRNNFMVLIARNGTFPEATVLVKDDDTSEERSVVRNTGRAIVFLGQGA
jgi:hypothetical protein